MSEAISIQTILHAPDGLPVRCVRHTPCEATDAGLPLIVICHGFKGFADWGLFPPLAERLAEGGREVLRFDLSHNGTAEDPEQFTRLDLFEAQTVSRHVADLQLVLEAFGVDREVWLVGHSLGGGVSLLAAAQGAELRGVATLNGVSHFHRVPPEGLAMLRAKGHVEIPNARTGQLMRLGQPWFDDLAKSDVRAVLPKVSQPVLILQGRDDTTVTPDEAEVLSQGLTNSELVLVPGGDHTFGARHPWAGWTDPLETAAQALESFLPSAPRR